MEPSLFGGIEWTLIAAAVVLAVCGLLAPFRVYRSLYWGGAVLFLSTELYRRREDLFGHNVFTGNASNVRLPVELFGIAWWILGAWLLRSLLTLVLRRTLFPNDNQPHARRLFADLAAGLIYVIAFVGIMDTVLKQPVSAVLATSGVLAIVLGLALQSTLGDVFSGLSLNIEQPFRSGDWITLADRIEGQVIEINWRATRLRTAANTLVMIPNSIIAKAVVTNHRHLNEPGLCAFRLAVANTVATATVIEALQVAAAGTTGVASDVAPVACACQFVDRTILYELSFGVREFEMIPWVQSAVIQRVSQLFEQKGITIGAPATEVRLGSRADVTPPEPAKAQPVKIAPTYVR